MLTTTTPSRNGGTRRLALSTPPLTWLAMSRGHELVHDDEELTLVLVVDEAVPAAVCATFSGARHGGEQALTSAPTPSVPKLTTTRRFAANEGLPYRSSTHCTSYLEVAHHQAPPHVRHGSHLAGSKKAGCSGALSHAT